MIFNESHLNTIVHSDCLTYLKTIPDNYFDLGCCDFPYGIDFVQQRNDKTKTRNAENKGWGWREVILKEWDKERFTPEIVQELFRVTKNQILWGGNYYVDMLYPTQGWLVWNKCQRNFSLADCELAWTSFDKASRIFDYARATHKSDEVRYHPTQKPVKLIEWCLDYAKLKKGAKVIDICSGSGTLAIAASNKKIDFLCIEKDDDYWKESTQRLANSKMLYDPSANKHASVTGFSRKGNFNVR